MKPLCFVLMPFGQKPDPAGGADIDFDRIWREALEPAIEGAGMTPIRADEERTGGIIHKPMFERLLLCDYALADMTTANANVFYELGVRHTARPSTTLTIFAKHQPIPFDVNFLRSMPYDMGEQNAFGEAEAAALRQSVTARLEDLRNQAVEGDPVDSPLFQLLGEWSAGDLARLKTDSFRDQVQANEALKARLAAIRTKGAAKANRAEAAQELADLRAELGPLDAVEAATAIDLMLTHRALEDWEGMIAIHHDMPTTLAHQILVREQLGFAYNRLAGQQKEPALREKALTTLAEVEEQQGASSETCGLIGRVHKDAWEEALGADPVAARGHLRKAIDAYRRGFMADPRDAYPGINLVTLLEVRGDDESLADKTELLPLVRFAVERRMAATQPDYWDHATLLELAVLENDPARAERHHEDAVAVIRETWEPGTTARNLSLIAEVRDARGVETTWVREVIADLERRAG